MLQVAIVAGPDKGSVFRLPDRLSHVVGRFKGSVPLNDQSVSRHHARFSFHNGHWLITDLGSANGTYLNDTQIEQPAELNDGDQLEMGRTLIQVRLLSLDEAGEVDHIISVLPTPAEQAAKADDTAQGVEVAPSEARPLPAATDVAVLDGEARNMLGEILQTLHSQPADRVERKLEEICDQLKQDTAATHEDAGLTRLEEKLEDLRQRVENGAELRPMLETLQARLDDGIGDKLDTLIDQVSDGGPGTFGRVGTLLADTNRTTDLVTATEVERKLDRLTHLVEKSSQDPAQQNVETMMLAVRNLPQVHPDTATAEQIADLQDSIDSLPQRLVEAMSQVQIAAPTAVDPALHGKLDAVLEALAQLEFSGMDSEQELKLSSQDADRLEQLRQSLERLPDVPDTQPLLERILDAVQNQTSEADLKEQLARIGEELAQIRNVPAAASTGEMKLSESDAAQLGTLQELLQTLPQRLDQQPLLERVLAEVQSGTTDDQFKQQLADIGDELKHLRNLPAPTAPTELKLSESDASRLGSLQELLETLPQRLDQQPLLEKVLAALESSGPDSNMTEQLADIRQALDDVRNLPAVAGPTELALSPADAARFESLQHLLETLPQRLDHKPMLEQILASIDGLDDGSDLRAQLDEVLAEIRAGGSDEQVSQHIGELQKRIEALPEPVDQKRLFTLVQSVLEHQRREGRRIDRLAELAERQSSQPAPVSPPSAPAAPAPAPAPSPQRTPADHHRGPLHSRIRRR